MDSETKLYREIQSLDSEMQTLVYENYNKFISATETIKKMSKNFDQMEQELNSLSERMDCVTSTSDEITSQLKERRENVSKLATTHGTLKKLNFLFDLGPKIQSLIESKSYSDAVKHYLRAEKALNQYKNFASISSIEKEVNSHLVRLKEKLHESFLSSPDEISIQDLTSNISLLIQLKENPHFMAFRFLKL